MKFEAIEGNTQKLDGGAMFGNCPKALWERWIPADERNRITLAARSLMVTTDEGKRILFDVGIGAFFEPKLKDRFGVVEGNHVLIDNLAAMGIGHEGIDAIVLSHLHFDHAGGLLTPYDGSDPKLLFPNAKFYVSKEHWEHAHNPPRREKASFLPHLHKLLEESGRLQMVEGTTHDDLEGITFSQVHGHSFGVLLSQFNTPDGPLAFVTDLIPGMPWMHLPITMGYDRFPELLVEEKHELLTHLLENNGSVFFTHDPHVAFAKVGQDEKGRFCGQVNSTETNPIPV